MNIYNSKTAEKLSNKFAYLLSMEIGDDNLRKVVDRNRAENCGSVCHSHDYCDANMIMVEAFKEVCKREPDLNNRDDVVLIDQAWKQAKDYNFNL